MATWSAVVQQLDNEPGGKSAARCLRHLRLAREGESCNTSDEAEIAFLPNDLVWRQLIVEDEDRADMAFLRTVRGSYAVPLRRRLFRLQLLSGSADRMPKRYIPTGRSGCAMAIVRRDS